MERTQDIESLNKITITNPYVAQYLTDNRAIILGSDKCCIIDPTINSDNVEIKKIKKFHPKPTKNTCYTLTVHPKKQQIALSYAGKLKIYDVISGKKKWSKTIGTNIFSCAFCPDDPTIFVHSGTELKGQTTIKTYNYRTSKLIDTHCLDTLISKIVWHPHMQSICFTKHDKAVQIGYNPPIKIIPLPENANKFFQCSSDGSFIAVGSAINIYIIYLINTKSYIKMSSYKQEYFRSIAFHPTASILAILSKKSFKEKHCIEFWNVKTNNLIHAIKIVKFLRGFDLSFAPNAKTMLVALDNTCIVIPVPCAVDEEIAKEKTHIFYYFIFKHFYLEQQPLPLDIIRFIFTILIKL